jgi:hypothetical protein
LGYCQGYIASKLGRLSKARLNELQKRWSRSQAHSSPGGSRIVLDIMEVIRSPHFDLRHLAEFKARFGHPLTAEDVLDHVINKLLYVEKH